MRHHRVLGAALAAVVAVALLPACDPPRPVFVVTTLADGLDRAVGDGVCEVTEGVGDCSLRAAVAEAEAAGAGDVTVRAGTYSLTIADPGDGDADLDVTGDVRINWEQRQVVGFKRSNARVLEVHAGGLLRAHKVRFENEVGDAGDVVRVAGTLILGESSIRQGLELPSTDTLPALEVEAGGHVVLSNSGTSGTVGPAGIVNRGTVEARFSSLSGLSRPAIHTEPGATTILAASRVEQRTLVPGSTPVDRNGSACSGAMPASEGYNAVPNESCALAGPGDSQDILVPTVDRIPVGVMGCGEAYSFDGAGRVRPQDSDFDGAAACDIGASEFGTQVVISFLPRTAATVGSCYELEFRGTGPSRPYTWTVTGLPPGLAVDEKYDRIVGIPQQAGSFQVTFTARAPQGGGSATTTIDIAPSDLPPMVSC